MDVALLLCTTWEGTKKFNIAHQFCKYLNVDLFIWDMYCVCSQLRDAFIQQLTQGYSHYDRQLRNDLLIIASLIAGACTETAFVETGFVKQLTLFATFQEGNNTQHIIYSIPQIHKNNMIKLVCFILIFKILIGMAF